MSSGSKWTCKRCTYINYPASKKCVLCYSLRSSSSTNDAANLGGMCSSHCDTNTDSLLIIPPSPKTNCTSSDFDKLQEANALSKLSFSSKQQTWFCVSCNYENSQSTAWCSSCHYNRDSMPLETENAENKTMKISCTTPSGSPSKWSCTFCTYLNWNASLNCIMCKSSKSNIKDNEPNFNCQEDAASLSTSVNSLSISSSSAKLSLSPQLTLKKCPGAAFNPSKSADQEQLKFNSSPPFLVKDDPLPLSLSSKEKSEEDLGLISADCKNARFMKKHEMSSSTSSMSNATCSSEHVSSNSLYSTKISSNVRDNDHRLYKKRKRSQLNRLFLKACIGVVDDDLESVAAFIANGGNMSRAITIEEAVVMDRPSAFSAGNTLVHLAIRFGRKNILSLLLDPEISNHPFKRNPSNLSPDIADVIQKEIGASLRMGKDDFGCQYLSEFTTFQLPREIFDLPPSIRKVLLSELIDEHAQKELEEEMAINWLPGKSSESACHLYALWNRSAGDCLLDSVLQATWGVFDSNNSLRMAMSESLTECSATFYRRWRDWEVAQARHMGFTFNERQCYEAWAEIHALAQQPGASLEHCHIFVLSHILRRPIIVYGIKYLKSFRGETLGFAKFQGVYLPFFWEQSFCYTSPIALGYTRGHFSALVSLDAPENEQRHISYNGRSISLPLNDCEGNILPIHFTDQGQAFDENERRDLLCYWMDCHVTDDNLLVAKQRVGKRSPSVSRMLDEWLDHYRHITFTKMLHSGGGAGNSTTGSQQQSGVVAGGGGGGGGNSSEGENDDDD